VPCQERRERHRTESGRTVSPDHGHELIPRLEQTPGALSPVRSWVLAWARDIEIARRPTNWSERRKRSTSWASERRGE
jgi:hypothetical protein